MNKKSFFNLGMIFIILVFLATTWWVTNYFVDLPNRISQNETIVLGQNHFVPGSQAALRILTRNSRDATPIGNAKITVSFEQIDGGDSIQVFNGFSNNLGNSEVFFQVPKDLGGEHTLVIQTSSGLGSDLIKRPISISREYKILLTTDKPIYNPGQEIHLRALALSTFDLIPGSEEEIEFVIADGKGNRVFRKKVKTSEWGVANVDFRLASEVNTGTYKISAVIGTTSSEKSVLVEYYTHPKFKISLESDKKYYLQGERVHGTLKTEYFYGKPVVGGGVTLEGYSFDVDKIVSITLQGITDEKGYFEFEFDLPRHLTGQNLDGESGRFYIQASVTDLTDNTEISAISFLVSSESLFIDAIPEGGSLKSGIENIIYILTRYPDGTPAETSLEIGFSNSDNSLNLKTGAYGLAEVRYTPNGPDQYISIQARGREGIATKGEFHFEGQWHDETLLLRPNKPVYHVGESMELSVLSSISDGSAYLDILREGQTVYTQVLDFSTGVGQTSIELTPDLFGTLELRAYKVLPSGDIVGDTRFVIVENANDLNLSLDLQFPKGRRDSEGAGYYMPGETAALGIQSRLSDGGGEQAAVSLAVVDESVFAFTDGDQGFPKLFSMLEDELLNPKYDLHGFGLNELVSGYPVNSQSFYAAIEDVATASLAENIPQRVFFSLAANSHQETVEKAYENQRNRFNCCS